MDINFTNGSSIETLQTNGETTRGKRSEPPYWYNSSDICYDKEVVDKVLKPFCKIKFADRIKFLRKHPSEYIYLASGRKLTLWQRIWVDKICPLIRR